MTVLEKLLEVGLTCPVCGSEVYLSRQDTVAFRVRCSMCRCRGDLTHIDIDAFVSWIVLTGGPFTRYILPPPGMAVWVWEDTGEIWWFHPRYRISEIIRPWLEIKWEEK